MWKAIGFKLLCQILLHSLNDLMCSVAVLLFICAVSALASAHVISLSSLELCVKGIRDGTQMSGENFAYAAMTWRGGRPGRRLRSMTAPSSIN